MRRGIRALLSFIRIQRYTTCWLKDWRRRLTRWCAECKPDEVEYLPWHSPTALEVSSASPLYLDNVSLLPLADSKGILVTAGPDAHSLLCMVVDPYKGLLELIKVPRAVWQALSMPLLSSKVHESFSSSGIAPSGLTGSARVF